MANMKIYTKKGDAAETGLVGNVRVPKDDLRIRTYGTVDELNAALGMSVAEAGSVKETSELRKKLLRVQNELFQLGAELATPRGVTVTSPIIESRHVDLMEKEIDEMEGELTPLKNFILPGGTRFSSSLHLGRTIARRAERELATLHRAEPCRKEVLQYVNRLSDYLFVCARFANHLGKTPDVPWKK